MSSQFAVVVICDHVPTAHRTHHGFADLMALTAGAVVVVDRTLLAVFAVQRRAGVDAWSGGVS